MTYRHWWAIGDLQGCGDAFAKLLDRIHFDPTQDRLWLVGDLVNRGPSSLEVLNRVRALGPACRTVLGNHDLHLLGIAAGARKPKRGDTIQSILNAPDAQEIIDWIRRQPLCVADESYAMVHAGLIPQWSISDALRYSSEVESVLQSPHWRDFMPEMYGNEPAVWTDHWEGPGRLRMIVNVLTRLRFCDEQGGLDFAEKSAPSSQAPHLIPWFDAANARWRSHRIVFGHWSTLGLTIREDVIAIDTGCVWGGELTAVRLSESTPELTLVAHPCDAALRPGAD